MSAPTTNHPDRAGGVPYGSLSVVSAPGRDQHGAGAATDGPAITDIWSAIPPVACKGLCQDSCGPIAMSNDEDSRIRRRGFEIPPMAEALAALDRGEDYYCPALVDGSCAVYEDRPTICRLWGVTESMPCPHGCTPEQALTREESHELLRLSAVAGGGMAGGFLAGPEP
jgi:hypothetical protein